MRWGSDAPRCLAISAAAILAVSASAQSPDTQYDPRAVLVEARTEEQGILEQLAMIDAELESVLRETLNLREKVDKLDRQRAANMMAVEEAETRLANLEDGVRDQVRALYRLHRRGPAQLVFGADDPAELRRRRHYLVQLVEADAGRLHEFQTVRDKRKESLDALDADMARLSKLRATLEIKETELRDQRATRMDFLKKVRERRGMAMQAMGEREQARDRFDRTLDARMMPSVPNDAWAGGMGLSGPAVPTAPSQASSFRHAYGRIPWPVRGRLVRRFGPTLDPATGLQDNNRGIDIAAEFGEPVRGVYRGVVRVAGALPDLGQTVAIQHGSYTTIYAHLSGVRVEVGDVVNAGEVVGVVGNTGLTAAEGYRLSFEIRYNRSPQDPLPWLQQ